MLSAGLRSKLIQYLLCLRSHNARISSDPWSYQWCFNWAAFVCHNCMRRLLLALFDCALLLFLHIVNKMEQKLLEKVMETSVLVEAGRYVSVSKAAEILPFRAITIRGWARDGKIKAIKVHGMGYLLEVDSLMRYGSVAKTAGDGTS